MVFCFPARSTGFYFGLWPLNRLYSGRFTAYDLLGSFIHCSPVFGMALSSPPPSNPMRDIGLLPVVHSTYLAPGGDYSCLAFTHRPECRNGAHDNEVRALISRLAHESFDLVEAASQGILLARGCSPECRFDRATTIGLYHRFHSSSGSGTESYAPPSSLPSSQLTRSGSEPPPASDPMVPSSSWPSLPPSSSFLVSPLSQELPLAKIPLPPAVAAAARFPTQPTNYGSTPDFRNALLSQIMTKQGRFHMTNSY